ncbi:EpsG family protein [Aliarcobacter skirrowii]|uniref:EpsG family protein n=1 Tax=Aliarcobacter skirrowii TaxID=28200 RepID=UPI00384A5818
MYSIFFIGCGYIYITQSFIKDMGQLRNGLVSAILLFSVLPIIKREMFKFVFVVLLAFGIHAFSLIALPLYWLYPFFKRLKYSLIFLLVILSIISFYGGVSDLILSVVGNSSFISEKIIHKLEGYSIKDVTSISIISITGFSYVLFSIFSILNKERIENKSSVLTVFSMFHFYGVSLFLLFTGINTLNNRSLDLFSMTALPFLLITPLYFTKGISRVIFFMLIIVFCTLYFMAKINGLNLYETVF